jgi:5S rRNA maturation endonuclease (ribonuclease M5)
MSTIGFTDRGKTRLSVPPQVAAQIGKTIAKATQALYQEGERRRRDHTGARQRWVAPRDNPLKYLVFQVLPEALDKATGGGQYPVSARSLFYQVRPLLQAYTTRELDYSYFSQTLLTEYRDLGRTLLGLYYDPRGLLYEPHEPPLAQAVPYTGRTVPLGTQAVEGYDVPAWLYDKILYIEKKGIMPVLAAARLGDRYDMAVVAGEGYASEATRSLLQHAEQYCQIYVLHDADPDGYNIARTLREETTRMPGYQVDVIDLGLTIAQARDMELATETFVRQKELPTALYADLTDLEREYFVGTPAGRKRWHAWRVELNAMTGPQLAEYIERRMKEEGATGKVIPDDEALPDLVETVYQEQFGAAVTATVREFLSLDAIEKRVAREMRAHIDLETARQRIEDAFAKNDTQSWHAALCMALRDSLDEHADILAELVRAQVVATVRPENRRAE